MTIKSLKMKNLLGFVEIEVSFDKNVTYLVGKNGSGKSSVGLTGIWIALQGISQKAMADSNPLIGERFRFIGTEDNAAYSSVVIHDDMLDVDITVIRKITDKGTQLSFEAPPISGLTLDQSWLNELFDSFMFNPQAFEQMSPVDQAISLGIDVSEFDQNLKEVKDDYTLINRQIKSFGELKPLSSFGSVAYIDTNKVIKEFNDAQIHNEEVRIQNSIRTSKEEALVKAKKEIEALAEKLKTLHAEYNNLVAEYKAMPDIPTPIDLEPFNTKLQDAQKTNELFREYEETKKKHEELSRLKKSLEENVAKQNKITKEKLAYIKGKKLPYDNLVIDDNGGLLLDGRQIKRPFFSTGELKEIILNLAITRNPKLRYAFIQDFNLLDEDTQKRILSLAEANNIQLVIEYVAKEKGNLPNAILLSECQIVD